MTFRAMAQPTEHLIKDKAFSATVDASQGPIVESRHRAYLLSELRFRKLRADLTALENVALNLIAAAAGVAIVMAARWVEAARNKKDSPITCADWVVLVLTAVAAMLLWIISKKWPGERKKIVSEITTFFAENPESYALGNQDVANKR